MFDCKEAFFGVCFWGFEGFFHGHSCWEVEFEVYGSKKEILKQLECMHALFLSPSFWGPPPLPKSHNEHSRISFGFNCRHSTGLKIPLYSVEPLLVGSVCPSCLLTWPLADRKPLRLRDTGYPSEWHYLSLGLTPRNALCITGFSFSRCNYYYSSSFSPSLGRRLKFTYTVISWFPWK